MSEETMTLPYWKMRMFEKWLEENLFKGKRECRPCRGTGQSYRGGDYGQSCKGCGGTGYIERV